jgi:hypothetical protein
MRATDSGFVYESNSKIVIAEIYEGNEVHTLHSIFYGTKKQALDYGLIFQEDLQPNQED